MQLSRLRGRHPGPVLAGVSLRLSRAQTVTLRGIESDGGHTCSESEALGPRLCAQGGRRELPRELLLGVGAGRSLGGEGRADVQKQAGEERAGVAWRWEAGLGDLRPRGQATPGGRLAP